MQERQIVLDPEFELKVQQLTTFRKIPSVPYVVMVLAKALDELPVDMAEDVIYHSLVTSSLGGKQLNQEELILSLLELCRIRAEKGDGFSAVPTGRWNILHTTPEYQAVAKIVDCPLEMGLVLHTISSYLRENSSAEAIHRAVVSMQTFKYNVEWLLKEDVSEEAMQQKIDEKFLNELHWICSTYVYRKEYLQAFTYESDNVGEFEIAFANLFIMMANTARICPGGII